MPLTLPPLPSYPSAGNEGERADWSMLADLHLRNAHLDIAEKRWAKESAAPPAGVMPPMLSPLAQIVADLLVKRLEFDRSISQADIDACVAAARMVLASTAT